MPTLRTRTLALLIFMAVAGPAPPTAQDRIASPLPTFHHKGVVLDYKGLKYNPCDDVIIPSVVRTDRLQKPLGRYYLYYAPHNAPGGICLAYADAPEGPWRECEGNPLINRDWAPHYKVSHVSGPHALWIDEEKKLFVYYHGENDVTRFASSKDGTHFQYEGVAVTTKDFDAISEASYARIFRYTIPGKDNRFIMLLMGNNRGTRRIYLAWSKDGRKWGQKGTFCFFNNSERLNTDSLIVCYKVECPLFLPWSSTPGRRVPRTWPTSATSSTVCGRRRRGPKTGRVRYW